MRDSLTILAIALILVLTAALVGPYFVDWNSQREWIEARLTSMLGAEARIRGPIDLKLLPTPYFVVENIEIAGNGGQAPSWRLSAKKLRLEIAPAALMHGDVDFVEARLEAPRLDLILDADGSLAAPSPAGSLADDRLGKRLRFEKIKIANGVLHIDDPAKSRAFELRGVSFEAEAASLSGPFKGQGTVEIQGERTPFRLSTGASEKGEMKLKLALDARGSHPSVALDGRLGLRAGAQTFAGAASFESAGPPWRASGQLAANARKAVLESIDLRIGAEEHPLRATGQADVDFSAAPKASVTLHSDDVDLDLADNGADPRTLLASFGAAPPLPLVLSYSAGTLSFGGASFTDLSTDLVFGGPQADEASAWLRLETRGPGKSRLFLDGRWRNGTAAGFDGKVQASAGDIRWLGPWLRPLAPQWTPKDLFFRTIDFSAAAHVSHEAFRLRDIDANIDGSHLSGTFEYKPLSDNAPARFDANLTTPSIDLVALNDFDAPDILSRAFSSGDGALRLDADALNLGTAESIGALSLAIIKTGDEIALDELTFEGLGGAVVTASGALSKEAARLDAHVVAPRDDRLTAALARISPSPAAEFVASHAGLLTPIDLNVSGKAAQKGEAFAITALSAKGTMGETKIATTVEGDPGRPDDLSISAIADAKDGLLLLRLLGFDAPASGLGAAHVELKAHGPLGQNAQAKIAASMGAANLTFDGEINTNLSAASATGQVRFTSPDAAPVLRATGLVFPDFVAKVPATIAGDLTLSKAGFGLDDLKADAFGSAVSGALAYAEHPQKALTGSINIDKIPASALFALVLGAPEPVKAGSLWSSLAFAPAAFDLPDARIGLTIHDMALPPAIFSGGMPVKDAHMNLLTGPGLLHLQDLELDIDDGRIAGDVKLRRVGAEAALESQLDFADLAVNLPSLRGRLSGALDFGGTGKTPDALAAGLAGSGHAIITDVTVPHADPAALTRVFAAFDQDGHSTGKNEIAAALMSELKRADFKAGNRAFDVSVASGVLRLSAPQSESAGLLGASFDFRRPNLTQNLTFVLNAPPKDWNGPPPQISVLIKGPISTPAVQVDAAALSNALSMRAIMRESARIEAYEFDIHERAFFYQRLLSERRREKERLKAAGDPAAEQKPPHPAE